MLRKGNDERRNADRGGIVGAFFERRVGMADGRGTILFAVPSALETRVEAPREHCVGGRIIRLELQRLFEERQCPRCLLRHRQVTVPRRAQHQVVSVEILGSFARDPRHLGLSQARLDRPDDAERDLVLQGEDVVELAVVTLRPQMRAGRRRRSAAR